MRRKPAQQPKGPSRVARKVKPVPADSLGQDSSILNKTKIYCQEESKSAHVPMPTTVIVLNVSESKTKLRKVTPIPTRTRTEMETSRPDAGHKEFAY